MKRKLLSIMAVVGMMTAANAQTEAFTSKNGHQVTPESGDWAIGFDANPMLNYFGNALNGNTGNGANTAFENGDQAIYGKYFLDESTAVRARLRIGTGSASGEYFQGDGVTTNDTLLNTWSTKGGNFVLGVGYEMRKGKGRLQGFYGGELTIMSGGGSTTEYTYGAAMDSTNLADGWASYNTFPGGPESNFGGARLISSTTGSTFGIGLRGFIGVEYFFAPKMSIAGEYGWGLMTSSTKEGVDTYEYMDNAEPTVRKEGSRTNGPSKSFGIDTDNLGGSIRLTFHF